MPDGNHLSPDAPIAVYVDGNINALPFIADLKRAGWRLVQEDGKTFLRRSAERSRPMDCINDVAAVVDQLRGVADTLSAVDPENLSDGTLARIGSAVDNLLEQASDRLAEARNEPQEEHEPTVLDRDRGASVRAYLASVRPLHGCCFCSDDGFYAGQNAIAQLADAIELRREQRYPDIADCVDMLFFLSNVQPLDEGNCYAHSGQAEAVGFNVILDHIRDTIAEYHEKNDL